MVIWLMPLSGLQVGGSRHRGYLLLLGISSVFARGNRKPISYRQVRRLANRVADFLSKIGVDRQEGVVGYI